MMIAKRGSVGFLVALSALAGCSSSGTGQPAASSTPANGSSTPVVASSSSTSSSASVSGAECGGAVARVTPAVARFTEITKIVMIAACGEVDIRTTLPSGVLGSASATKGVAICQAAAKVAYRDTVASITVTDKDGHELAAGLKSMDCIPG